MSTDEPNDSARLAHVIQTQDRLGQIAVAIIIAVALMAGVVMGSVGHDWLIQPVDAQPTRGVVAASSSANTLTSLQGQIESVASKVGPAVVSIRTNVGLGSGVIYDASGLILTNAHVVEGANNLTVGLVDGRHFSGKVLGTNTGFDLAVVKIDGKNLPTAPLGDSNALQVGQFVVAIGTPYGYDHSVTTGVISGLNRPVNEGLSGSYNQPMLQTDAAINPGNSGGPLVDLAGKVIGINTLIATPEGIPAEGLGFAVPSNTAQRIAAQLAKDGKVTNSGQPYLGVSLGDLYIPSITNEGSRSNTHRTTPTASTGVDHGALVGQVSANSAAEEAGLRTGDVITSFNGRDVYYADELLNNLVLHKPGDKVKLTVVRDGQTLDLILTLGEAPVK